MRISMEAYLAQILVFAAACPRIIGLVALAPGFDSAFVPPLVRIAISCALAFALAPLVGAQAQPILNQTPQAYIALLVTELLLGVMIGFFLACLLEAARLAGDMIDMQIGFAAGSLFDPLGATMSAVLGRFWYLLAVVYFFCVNGHHWLIAGLVRSFQVCPVGAMVLDHKLVGLAVDVMSSMFVLAVRMGAPVVAALILADLTLGLVGRSMPQMNVLLVGMPGKIMVGIGALLLSTPSLVQSLGEMMVQFQHYLVAVTKLL